MVKLMFQCHDDTITKVKNVLIWWFHAIRKKRDGPY